MKKRILFTTLLFLTIFFTPTWVGALLVVVGALAFRSYYEILVAGLIFDLVYGVNGGILGGSMGVIFTSLVFLIALFAKKNVR